MRSPGTPDSTASAPPLRRALPRLAPGSPDRHLREQEPRLDTEDIGQLFQDLQIDRGDAGVFQPAYGGTADSSPRRQLGLREAKGQAELPEPEVDGHAREGT